MRDDKALSWHSSMTDALTHLLLADQDVVLLGVFGSAQRPGELDAWSDLDVLVVVRDKAMPRFYPSTTWLEPLGRLFAREQFDGDAASTTRVCFEDLRRLDLVIAAESSARRVNSWPQVAFANGIRVLFSRSAQIDACLAGPLRASAYTPPSAEQFARLADGFWFRAIVAIAKVARDDLVIGLHLALGLYQDCCVLTMMLRDRATGTGQHRTGGVANDSVATYSGTAQPPTAEGILNLVEATGRIFDRLALSWSESYRPRIEQLQAAVDLARKAISG